MEVDLRMVARDGLLEDKNLVGGVAANLPAGLFHAEEVSLHALDWLDYQHVLHVLRCGGRGKRRRFFVGLLRLLLG